MKPSVALAVLLIFATFLPAAAQPRGGRQAAPRLLSAETVLAMRERLALSPEQITRLTAIRREAVAERQGHLARMIELRSELAAGDITYDAFAARIGEDRDTMRVRADARAAQIRSILTADQRERLAELRGRRFEREWGRSGGWAWHGRRDILLPVLPR